MNRERKLELMDAPPLALDPIVRVVELDARIRVAVDVRRMSHTEHDEPSLDELQAYVLAMVKCHLEVQPWVGNVRVSWIDAAGLVSDIEE